jgi:hypothetical protein
MTREFRRERFGAGAVLIGQRDKLRIELLLIDGRGDDSADGSNAEDSDFQHGAA